MEKTKNKRLTKVTIASIQETYRSNPTVDLNELAREFGTTQQAIRRVLGLIKHRTPKEPAALPVAGCNNNGGAEKARTTTAQTEKAVKDHIVLLESKMEKLDSMKEELNVSLSNAYEFLKGL